MAQRMDIETMKEIKEQPFGNVNGWFYHLDKDRNERLIWDTAFNSGEGKNVSLNQLVEIVTKTIKTK